MTIHKHHLVPKHRGGKDTDGLVEVTPIQHAMFHYCEWRLWGHWQDKTAWRMLVGMQTHPEGGHTSENMRKAQSKAAIKKWKNPEYRKSQCAALKKAAKGQPGNKFRVGMKNKPHHREALVKSNRDRAVVYEIKKGTKTLCMTRQAFCKWFGYSIGSMYLSLRKRGHYKGWVFSPVST